MEIRIVELELLILEVKLCFFFIEWWVIIDKTSMCRNGSFFKKSYTAD